MASTLNTRIAAALVVSASAVTSLVVGSAKLYVAGNAVSTGAFSGSSLTANKAGAGTGVVLATGSLGGAICIRNTAGTMEKVTMVSTTLTVRPALAAECL